jgi:hypothetical protein
MEFSTVLLLICVPLLIISLYFVRRQANSVGHLSALWRAAPDGRGDGTRMDLREVRLQD